MKRSVGNVEVARQKNGSPQLISYTIYIYIALCIHGSVLVVVKLMKVQIGNFFIFLFFQFYPLSGDVVLAV